MEVTPKLHRKSLSLTSRLRSRSSASPSPRNRLRSSIVPSSPISIPNDGGVEATPPHRKFTFNPPYSPSNETDFSPRSRLSQSSNNSPDVTWRWTQDDQPTETISKSTPNSSNVKELRKKRAVKRKEELRKAEIEKRKAIKTKRDDDLKKQCEQVELIISKEYTKTKTFERDFVENIDSSESGFGSKQKDVDLFDDSAFDGFLEMESTALEKNKCTSICNKKGENMMKVECSVEFAFRDKDLDLLNDSESDGLLLEASQQAETSSGKKTKSNCTKELERSFENIPEDKEKTSAYDFLQDSFDDCFALVDEDAIATEAKKPKTSLHRYKSMPKDSATTTTLKPSTDASKIKRYPSSSTLRPKSKFH